MKNMVQNKLQAKHKLKIKIARNIAIALLIIFAINFLVLFSLGFPKMALAQLQRYLPLIIILILGFAIQIGLFTYVRHNELACSLSAFFSGGISSVSMILCCSHYLVNIVPFISLGAASFLTNYTFEILLFGIASNIFGILFIIRKIKQKKHEG